MRKLLNGVCRTPLLVVLMLSLLMSLLSAQGGEIFAPPRFVEVKDMDDHAFLTWEAPRVPRPDETRFSLTGDFYNFGVGLGGTDNYQFNDWCIAHRYTPEKLEEFGVSNSYLTEIGFMLNYPNLIESLFIEIYVGSLDDPFTPETLVLEQEVDIMRLEYEYSNQLLYMQLDTRSVYDWWEFPATIWNDIPLNSHIEIPTGQDLWIVLRSVANQTPFVIGKPTDEEADAIFANHNGTWESLVIFDDNWGWMIRGYATSDVNNSGNGFEGSFNVYKTENLDHHMYLPWRWTLLATNITDTEYLDFTWSVAAEQARVLYIVEVVNNGAETFTSSNGLFKAPENMDFIGDTKGAQLGMTFVFQPWYKNFLTQSIYLEEEFTQRGLITEIMFQAHLTRSLSQSENYKIYMSTTDKNAFTRQCDWVPEEDFVLVWEGILDDYFPEEFDDYLNIFITLDTPFLYEGGNIVVMGYSRYNEYGDFADSSLIHIRNKRTPAMRTLSHWPQENESFPYPPIDSFPNESFLQDKFANIGFIFEENFAPPRNLNAEVIDEVTVKLTWEAPNPKVIGYKVSRDGKYIDEITDLNIIDTGITEGNTYTYSVKALYQDGESEEADVTIIVLYFKPPTNLQAVDGGGFVLLEWEIPTNHFSHLTTLVGVRVYRDNEPLTTTLRSDLTSFIDREIEYNTEYSYFVKTIWGGENTGESEASNTVSIEIVYLSGNDDLLHMTTRLHGNSPNPFNPETTIAFAMKEAGKVSIEVYNVRGQKIRILVDEYADKGEHSVVWNGRDDNGRDVASGFYFYRMTTEGFSDTRRMLLMK